MCFLRLEIVDRWNFLLNIVTDDGDQYGFTLKTPSKVGIQFLNKDDKIHKNLVSCENVREIFMEKEVCHRKFSNLAEKRQIFFVLFRSIKKFSNNQIKFYSFVERPGNKIFRC